MRVRRRDYELVFIISPLRSGEEDLNNTLSRVQQMITSVGGEVTLLDHSAPWGRRKLAYPIRSSVEGEASRRSFSEGYYVLCHLKLDTTQLGELERSLKLNNSILRYLLVLIDTKQQAVEVGSAGADTVVLDLAGDEDEDAS